MPVYAEGGWMPQMSYEHEGWKLVVTEPKRAPGQMLITHRLLDPERMRELAPELFERPMPSGQIAALVRDNPAVLDYIEAQCGDRNLELYYLPDDPLEQTNLADLHPELVDTMFRQGLVARALAEEARKDASYEINTIEMSAEDRDMFQDLGYAGEED